MNDKRLCPLKVIIVFYGDFQIAGAEMPNIANVSRETFFKVVKQLEDSEVSFQIKSYQIDLRFNFYTRKILDTLECKVVLQFLFDDIVPKAKQEIFYIRIKV